MSFIDFITQGKNIIFAISAIITGFYLILLSNKKPLFTVNSLETVNLINNKHAIIIDLRTSSDFKKYHIAQSKNIPLNELETSLKNINMDKNIILVYTNDKITKNSTVILRDKGFHNTFYLLGGIDTWITDDLPIITNLTKE